MLLENFCFFQPWPNGQETDDGTIINRSYRIRTSSERFVARAIGHESPIALALVAFLIVFGIPFALMGVGAAYGAEPMARIFGEYATDSLDSIQILQSAPGTRWASARHQPSPRRLERG
jgi:hypothetical protein